MNWTLIILLSLAILAVSILSGALALRRSKNEGRGSLPGKGDHIIEANYSSGLGGHSVTYRVPKDPQDYAKRFIPRETRK
ncbi:hypothetical protein [Thalassococcus sp. S3]|uniref:hypothetical protein n=1 Tax=Thalassococcus sp. S3 TaxID=2017482 RepID=UPI00102409D1|nr:hypothetical protein [Thalassococcus sp. S3]QBF32220.1 hypothetical protein CFI11_13470 [Thalassococcus sp. S3]